MKFEGDQKYAYEDVGRFGDMAGKKEPYSLELLPLYRSQPKGVYTSWERARYKAKLGLNGKMTPEVQQRARSATE